MAARVLRSRRRVMATGGTLLLGLAACRSFPRREPLISGSITYRGPVGLQPEDEIVIRILDTNDVSRPAIAEQRIHTDRQVPIPFSLAYDTDVLESSSGYVIDAQIWRRGRVLFALPQPVPINPYEPVTNLVLTLEPAPVT
jgi:uncharacterized lipoprotein YbaY